MPLMLVGERFGHETYRLTEYRGDRVFNSNLMVVPKGTDRAAILRLGRLRIDRAVVENDKSVAASDRRREWFARREAQPN